MRKSIWKAVALFPSLVALLLVSVLADAKKPSRKPRAAIQVGEWPEIKLRDFRKAVNLAQVVFGSTTCDALPPKVDAQGRAIALRFRVKTAYPGYVSMFWQGSPGNSRATSKYYWSSGSSDPNIPPDWIVPSYNPLIYAYLWIGYYFRAETVQLDLQEQDFQIDLSGPITQTMEGWPDLEPNALAPTVVVLLIPSILAVGVDNPISSRAGADYFPIDIWNYRRLEPCVRKESDRRWGQQHHGRD